MVLQIFDLKKEKELSEQDIDLNWIFNTASSLTNFDITQHYQNEPRFNGVYSRDKLPTKIKDGVYVINLDEYSDIGTHWIALYALNNDVTYFNSFEVEHIQK